MKIGMFNRNLNECVMTFDSIEDACEYSGLPVTIILNVLEGRDDHACGFLWRYLE